MFLGTSHNQEKHKEWINFNEFLNGLLNQILLVPSYSLVVNYANVQAALTLSGHEGTIWQVATPGTNPSWGKKK